MIDTEKYWKYIPLLWLCQRHQNQKCVSERETDTGVRLNVHYYHVSLNMKCLPAPAAVHRATPQQMTLISAYLLTSGSTDTRFMLLSMSWWQTGTGTHGGRWRQCCRAAAAWWCSRCRTVRVTSHHTPLIPSAKISTVDNGAVIIGVQDNWPPGLPWDIQNTMTCSNCSSCSSGSWDTRRLAKRSGCSSTGRRPAASRPDTPHCCSRIVAAAWRWTHLSRLHIKLKHKKDTLTGTPVIHALTHGR